jgi:DNA-binding Lrp family transcriptional regulator
MFNGCNPPAKEEAVILIRVKPGYIFKVAREAKKHNGVKFGNAVAGLYDVALFVSTQCLEDVVEKIHSIPGIERIEILVALKAEYST